jgi:hypothetical protein
MSTTKPLGRREPTDWEHVEKYPLTLPTVPAEATPVTLGINWYANFDEPFYTDRHWRIGKGDLGALRGGHCICAKPQTMKDSRMWWRFYDQGEEGACVGFAISRSLSLMNRERYDGEWNYKQAQLIDDWEGEDYSGTSVRAGLEVIQTQGPCRVYSGQKKEPDPVRGISAYRWATSVEMVIAALAHRGNRIMMDKYQAIPFLNSWGEHYPQIVWLPYKVLDRLLDESGEAAIITDR